MSGVAITAVPGHVLSGGKSVAANLVRVSQANLADAPVLAGAAAARANPLSVVLRPPGAPALRAPSANEPGVRIAAPFAATPNRGSRTVTVPPTVYGGVTDGQGAYTGVAPTPGPKQPEEQAHPAALRRRKAAD